MNRSGTMRDWGRSSVTERSRWDSTVKALDGSVLQSWAWGEWYRQWGFELERIRVDGPQGTGLAQVLIWPHGSVAEARIARGPVLSGGEAAMARELFAAVDEVCERHQPLTLTVEPPAPLPLAGTESAAGFLQGAARWCCPGRTVIVPLLDDESLFRRMRKKTRQQVRRPERRGVTVEQSAPDAAGLMTFYALLDDTSRRTEFSIEPLSYYERFMRHLTDEAILLFARTQRGVAAGLIITCFGNEAISHFGGSSSELRCRERRRASTSRLCAWHGPSGARGSTCGGFQTRIHPRSRGLALRDRVAAIGEGSITSSWAWVVTSSCTHRSWRGATRRGRAGHRGGEDRSVRKGEHAA